jgi:hypothetical protein
MGSTWNMPPGVSTDMIPGNGPELSEGDGCPKCHESELFLHKHLFDEDGGLPDYTVLHCPACGFHTDPE